MRNVIAIERGLVLVPAGTGHDPQQAATLQAELMNLGFMLNAAAFAAVSAAPREWVAAFFQEVVPHLQKQVGADRNYQPFYRNFPTQVMETSALALFLNALTHYWSNGRWEPAQIKELRPFAFEGADFKTIRPGTDDDLKGLFTTLVSAGQSLTAQDKEAVERLIDVYGGGLMLPREIPFKETLCILAAKGLDVPVKTTTDVLRVAVYLSGGDISLPMVPKLKPVVIRPGTLRQHVERLASAHQAAREKFKFKKFSRQQRRLLLGLLEKTNVDLADMQRHLGRWLRLGEVLHVGEYTGRFPRSAAAFHALRNQRPGTKIRTFAASVDLAFARDWRAGLELLVARPGEFARRLDWMLRSFDQSAVLAGFERVGNEVSAKVLLELCNHFIQRAKADAPRTVMIKGARAKMKTLQSLPPMNPDLVRRVTDAIVETMRRRIATLPPLGAVWIDPALKHLPIPFAMRSVNTAVKTYVRGTRIRFGGECRVIRPFIHWFDEDGSQDLDLSVGLYSTDLRGIGRVSFTGLKDLGCCHSGDIRHRQGACAEYVDIPLESATSRGVRFATVQVHNYNARPMHTVKDCVFGLMERQDAVANEIFVPRTISNCMALANEGTSVIVCIIDLLERHYIWADIETRTFLPTLENTAGKTADVLRALIHGTKMSVHDLLTLHANARGFVANDPAAAEVQFRSAEFITNYARVASFMNF